MQNESFTSFVSVKPVGLAQTLQALGIQVIPKETIDSYKTQKLALMPQSNLLGRLFDASGLPFQKTFNIISSLCIVGLLFLCIGGVLALFAAVAAKLIWSNDASSLATLAGLEFTGVALLFCLTIVLEFAVARFPSRWVEVCWDVHAKLYDVPILIRSRALQLQGLASLHVIELREGDVLCDPILVARNTDTDEECYVGIWESTVVIV